MIAGTRGIVVLLICLAAGTMPSCSRSAATTSKSWDARAAATYLDSREGWWMSWNSSARDHGTFCVSCHTALPYALARPSLRAPLGEPGPSENERRLIENVRLRVQLWNEIGPYYSDSGYDHKSGESRGTESVLNALILSRYDAQNGKLSDSTRAAFDHMWALQQTAGEERGSWPWLQFDQEPWEAKDSGFYGAALAAMAVGMAPGGYASTVEIKDRVTSLRDYLNRESSAQSTLNRGFLLWASTKLPLLTPAQQQAIQREILSKQQADGGWRLASIAWKWNAWSVRSLVNMWLRADGTPLEGKSDGAATSLMVLALQQAGLPRDNAQLQRGLEWLITHQNTAEGFWTASSVNKRRHLSSDTGRFMSDAATAFAVLALTESQRPSNAVASISPSRTTSASN